MKRKPPVQVWALRVSPPERDVPKYAETAAAEQFIDAFPRRAPKAHWEKVWDSMHTKALRIA